jgi:hypothetical protein
VKTDGEKAVGETVKMKQIGVKPSVVNNRLLKKG